MGLPTRLIAFTLYPGVGSLDLVGPLTVLRDLRFRSPYRTVVVSERVSPIRTDTRLHMVPTSTFADVPSPFALIVPGAGEATMAAIENEAFVSYIRSAAARASFVGATGNGALVLAAAGLLPGRRAAIHWAYANDLERLGAIAADQPWIADGRFITAGGGTGGIDAMLHLAARLTGRSRAVLAQLAMEYDPQPPFAVDRRPDADIAAVLRSPGAAREEATA